MKHALGVINRSFSWALSLPVRLYRYLLSPLWGSSCRFYPTCSQYALEALDIHGPIKGCFLILRRLLKCQPWCSRCGYDPVPEKFDFRGFFLDCKDHGHKETTDNKTEKSV